MLDNLSEPLTIDDMARVAMFSKFHFSRMFQRATGLSPGRFLSALRLQRAKQLLVSTSLNVADISMRVGYTSVGTFSSRFSRSVGLSPTTYRRLGGFAPQIHPDSGAEGAYGTVRGVIHPHPTTARQLTFVGLFPDRIPEGRPVSCAILDRAGQYALEKVPKGAWYLLAHAVPAGTEESSDTGLNSDDLSVGIVGPIDMRRDSVVESVDLQLKPMRTMDPPVLLALFDVRKDALIRAGAHSGNSYGPSAAA
ncbi:helix-turn-helix transcriptional regulator [Micromonospora sp. NPDC049523]|uniref:helix-turn-helix transcriptional regulator n=1 Tax=Micromonospora sp. NPDC049523 TaxID=3155921 RepID=UPI00342C984E